MEMKTNNHVWGQYKNRIVICSGCHDKIKGTKLDLYYGVARLVTFAVDALLLFTTPRKRVAK
jgi:hypothetical protein